MLYAEVLSRLLNANVDYLIIGGVAVNLQGYSRLTKDLDLMLKMKSENLLKAVEILLEAGFTTWLPVDPRGIADDATRRDWLENKNMLALSFKRGSLKLDILFSAPIRFEDMHRDNFRIGRFLYPVASKEDLIRLKEVTGRPHDREDVDRLRILINLEKEGHSNGADKE